MKTEMFLKIFCVSKLFKSFFLPHLFLLRHGHLDSFISNLRNKNEERTELRRKKKLSDGYNHYKKFKHKDLNIENFDNELLYACKTDNFEKFLHLLRQSHSNPPPHQQILRFIGTVSQVGKSDVLLEIKQFSVKVYPTEYEIFAQYDYYLAEILWKQGRIDDSLSLFNKVYDNYPHLHRKISALLRFLIFHIIDNQPDKLNCLLNLIKACVWRKQLQPVIHLWKELFIHKETNFHETAVDLLYKYPSAKSLIPMKVDSIVQTARSLNRTEILFRFASVLDSLNFKEERNRVINSLVELCCENNEWISALEVCKQAHLQQIPLSFNTLQKLVQYQKQRNLTFGVLNIKPSVFTLHF